MVSCVNCDPLMPDEKIRHITDMTIATITHVTMSSTRVNPPRSMKRLFNNGRFICSGLGNGIIDHKRRKTSALLFSDTLLP